MPRTLSLCVIARNEEAMLSGCLESVAGAVDEIVVVDTGSTDRTIEVALAHGARVLEKPWTDDFSAARNAALEVATGDFVFFLDADERLEQAAMGVLRRLVRDEAENAAPTVYAPLILNVDAAGASLGADHMPRLWRARPELRFTGRIHEQIGVGVTGLKLAYEDALTIIHLGYDPVLAKERGKHDRNIALLDRELAERPDDPALIFYRAKESYALGDDAAAAEGFQRVIREAPGLNYALSSYVFAVECLRSIGRSDEALHVAMDGVRHHAKYSELWYAAGMAALDLGKPVQAEALFREATVPSDGFALTAFNDPDIRAFRAELGRGQALRVQNLPEQALKVWLAVHDRVPLGPRAGAARPRSHRGLPHAGAAARGLGAARAHARLRPRGRRRAAARVPGAVPAVHGTRRGLEVLLEHRDRPHGHAAADAHRGRRDRDRRGHRRGRASDGAAADRRAVGHAGAAALRAARPPARSAGAAPGGGGRPKGRATLHGDVTPWPVGPFRG
jgi:glycosyltransferase involved in cell wall biosynthesis